MEHFLFRIKCCKCDERLDVGHKGKQWLWSDLIILILLDSQSPVLLFELLGRMKLLALLREPRQEGRVWAVIVAFQPFIHLAIPSRLLKYQRSSGISELRGWGNKRKEERNVMVWKSIRDLFGILHMAASGISFDPLLLITRELVHCSPKYIYGKQFSSSLFRGLPNGETSSLHSNAPSNHLLNLGFSSSSSMLLIQHLKSILCPVKGSE